MFSFTSTIVCPLYTFSMKQSEQNSQLVKSSVHGLLKVKADYQDFCLDGGAMFSALRPPLEHPQLCRLSFSSCPYTLMYYLVGTAFTRSISLVNISAVVCSSVPSFFPHNHFLDISFRTIQEKADVSSGMQNSEVEFLKMLKEKQRVCNRVAMSGDPVGGEWESCCRQRPPVMFLFFVRSSLCVTVTAEFPLSTPFAHFFLLHSCQSERVA